MEWKNKKVGAKKTSTTKRKVYMTKARKINRAKNIFLLAVVLITATGLLGYSSIDEHAIASRLNEIEKDGRYITVKLKTVKNIQEFNNLPILEPTIEQVKDEIIRQAKDFKLDPDKMLALADCESDFKWNVSNPNSTATGVYQFLSGTWGQTESSKKGISRLDYKANIREAMIDISNGESWRWSECLDKDNLIF